MTFKNFIQTTWQLPQNIVGLIAKKIFKAQLYTTYKDAKVYTWKLGGGVSLGKHIFVPFDKEDPESYVVQQYIKHEYGHTVQSKYLGWLYLIVIGIPSVTYASRIGGWYRKKTGKDYYNFYTEKWADKLGGVERK